MANRKQVRLTDRILTNYKPGISYHELMRLCFPEDQFPNAFNYRAEGGPPACAMPFGRALNQLGLRRDWRTDKITGTPTKPTPKP